MDEGFGELTNLHPFLAAANLNPSRADSGPHSRGGWTYPQGTGGNWTNVWTARSGDKWWLYFAFEVTTSDSTAESAAWVYSDYRATTGTQADRLRIVARKDATNPTTTYQLTIERFTTLWAQIAVGGNLTVGTKYYGRWEIDVTGKTTTLVIDNGAYIASTGTTNTPVVPGTPAFANIDVGAKGATVFTVRFWEAFANDSSGAAPTTAQTYTSATSGYHVFGNYPNDDVGAAVWAATNPDAVCPTELWKTIDDTEDAADIAGDYIGVTGNGTNQDQAFEISDQPAGATVEAVGIVVALGGGVGYGTPSSILVKVPSAGASFTVYSPTALDQSFGIRVWLPVAPDGAGGAAGAAWDLDTFNEIQVGVRNSSASSVQRAYVIHVATIGTGQERPAQAVACVAASTFAPKVMMF